MKSFFVTAAFAAALVTLGPAVAAAQRSPPPPVESGAARAAFLHGLRLFDRGDFDAALAEFLRAHQLSQRPVVLYNIGASQQALHRYPEAIEALQQYLAQAPADAPQREGARRALADMEQLVARVALERAPPDAEVAFDGQPPVAPGAHGAAEALVLLRPGAHTYVARRAGYETAQGALTVHVGERRTLRVELARVEPAPGRAPDARPAQEPLLGRLLIAGVTTDAHVRVREQDLPASVPLELPPGTHPVWVGAPGRVPWQGNVTLTAGSTRTLRVQLALSRSGLAPGWFALSASLAGALGVAGLVTGLETLSTAAAFAPLTREDPMAASLEARGRALSIATDVLLAGCVGAAVTSVVLLTRTEFSPAASSAELARRVYRGFTF